MCATAAVGDGATLQPGVDDHRDTALAQVLGMHSWPPRTTQSIANKDFLAKMAKRQITEETIHMKAIVVTDQAAGTAGMTLVERPEPQAAINDVLVQVHASGFTSGELTW